MKKTIISTLALASIALAGTAYAEETAVTTSERDVRIEMRKDAIEKQAEMRKEALEKREEVRGEVREIHKDIKTATSTDARKAALDRLLAEKKKAGIERANHIMSTFDHKIAKLADITKRVEARIADFKAKGRDVSQAEAKLAEARIAVGVATAKVAALKTAVTAALTNTTSTTPLNDALKAFRSQIRDTEDSIRKAEKALHAAMKARIPRGTKPTTATTTPPAATTTPTTSTTSTTN